MVLWGSFMWGVPVGARRSERPVRGRGAACERLRFSAKFSRYQDERATGATDR